MTTPRDNRCGRPSGRTRRPGAIGRPIGALLLALGVAAAPVSALAEPQPLPAVTDQPDPPADESPGDTQVDRAMEAYQRGTQNYNLAQYEAALADFKEAASLYASPDFQYNIGLCYEKLGKYDEAIRAFATYLKAKPDAEDRPNVEDRIRQLQRDIERQRREAEEAAAERQPDPTPPPETTPADPTTDRPSGNEGRPLVIAGAALLGVGAAVALGGGIGFGIAARDRSLTVDEIQTGGNPEGFTFAETEAFEADGKRFEAAQVGMAAAGSLVAVTGAVLLALGLRKRNAARARVQARAGAWVAPGHAGLSLTGRF